MAKKKRKKGEQARASDQGAAITASPGQSEEGTQSSDISSGLQPTPVESLSGTEPKEESEEPLRPGEKTPGKLLAGLFRWLWSNGQGVFARLGGILARLFRWLEGPPQPAETPLGRTEDLPKPPMPEPLPEEEIPPEAAAEPSPAPAVEARSEFSSESGGPPRASPVDQLLASLTLERVLPELEAARNALEELERASEVRIRLLEAERDQSRAEADRARAEKSEIEARARPLRKALDVMEERLAEERKGAEERIRQLEAERDQNRLQRESAAVEEHDLRLRIRQLEAMLDIRQSTEASAERDRLTSELASREEELGVLREQSEALRARVGELESALEHAQPPVSPPEVSGGEPRAAPAAESALVPLPTEAKKLTEFYERAMHPLTVILASADLLAMNPRAEPSWRETAREIRKYGERLRDLIQEHTLPPAPPKAP